MTESAITGLLPAQEAHWELVRALSPGDPGRSRQLVLDYRHLDGWVDERALMRAFADVARRHENLRAGFRTVGSDPEILVSAAPEPPTEFLDVSGLGASERRARIAELILSEGQRCFDLRGPLWHAWILRQGAASHWLIISLSHIIADGWSSKVFLDDLLIAYEAQTGAGPGWADDVPALRELGQLQAAWLQPSPERLRYWRDRLVALPGPSLFPPPPDTADLLARSNVSFWIPAATTAQIHLLAWQTRTTPFLVLMAAHHLQLALALGKSRIVVSTAALAGISGRERRAICQHAADPYVPLDATEDRCLRDLLREVHFSMTGALAHMAPFTSIARAVNPRFDDCRPWADPHLFDGNFIDSAFALGELTVSGIRIVRTPIALRELCTSACSELVWAGLPPVSRPVWETLSGPGFEINAARDGGVVHFNDQVIPEAALRDFVDRYLWVTQQVASAPEMTMGALRENYEHRFGG